MINIPAMVAALFKKEEWQAVGYLDYSLQETIVNRSGKRIKSKDIDGRIVFLVSDKNNRKLVADTVVLQGARNVTCISRSIAWTEGAPLPDDFKPLSGPDRKPWKVPEKIRGQFNKEK